MNTIQTDSRFSNNIQKMVSVSASIAAAKFIEIIRNSYPGRELAFFNSWAWLILQDEVNKYFTWRQQDTTKNRISMAVFADFKYKELQGLNSRVSFGKNYFLKEV